MATASLTSSPKIRQIAILVSSVDATVARQLLLHLPTEMAKQVRAMANQLGPVTAAERQAILSEFQKSAGRSQVVGSSTPSPQPVVATTSVSSSTTRDEVSQSHQRPAAVAVEDANAPGWTRLSTPALVRFVKGERTIVGALVISRLTPEKGVDVLRQLPREMHREILKRIAQLQDVDPSAMAAIDEHLVERLSEYQTLIESEQSNLRRLSALLAAAPPELQYEWQQVLDEPQDAPDATQTPSVAVQPLPSELQGRTKVPLVQPQQHQRNLQATIAELYGDAVITAAANMGTGNQASSQPALSPAELLAAKLQAEESADELLQTDGSAAIKYDANTAEDVDEADDQPNTISFNDALRARNKQTPVAQTEQAQTSLSHSSSQTVVNLGPLLDLGPHKLAALLSNVDAPTVLLALAGSTPAFMRRFNALLQPGDAKALNDRLQMIGTINLRDVDAAQRRLMQAAARLNASATTTSKAA